MATDALFNWTALEEAEAPVLDSNSKKLGTLGGGRADYFKVNVSGGFDYWLPQDEIASADSEGVLLKHSEDELEGRKHDDAGESLTSTELEEATDDSGVTIPEERRYENEAEYLSRPHQ